MKSIWMFAAIAFTLLNCNNKSNTKTNLLSKIPNSSNVVLKINNLEAFKSRLKNNTLLKELNEISQSNNFSKLMKSLEIINSENTIYICMEKQANDSLGISIISEHNLNVLNLDSVPNLSVESIKKKKGVVEKITLDNFIFYRTLKDSVLFLSNNLPILEESLESKKINQKIKELFDTSNPEKSFSIFINQDQDSLNLPTDAFLIDLPLSNYSMLDIDVSQNDIYINGITETADSTNKIISFFKGTTPVENKMAMVCPTSTNSFTSFTGQNMSFLTNSKTEGMNENSAETNISLNTIVEFGYAKIQESDIIVLRSIDTDMTIDEFEIEQTTRSFRETDIYKVNDVVATEIHNIPLLPKIDLIYFCNLDEFFIFSKSIATLEYIISNFNNGNVIGLSDSYKDLVIHLSDESSILTFKGSQSLEEKINETFDINTNLKIDDYRTNAFQYIQSNGFAHINAVFKTFNNDIKSGKIIEESNIKLDAKPLSKPQFLKNHTNSEMDIAIQDITNQLYLIDNKGKLLWKKQIDGEILGEIKQIDIFKNGRLQLVFSTSKKLYALDRNENKVGSFPLSFNKEITQPLSVFDYENNRNYRLLITQGNNLFMYDKKGERVSGFNYPGGEGDISTQPKHFRIGGKDYIVFAENNKMKILNRVGKTRINVKEDVLFSNNDIYLYNNKFTTTNTNGELLQINKKGQIQYRNLNLKDGHKTTTTSKTLVTLSDNNLTIKNKSIELDFGSFTKPQIFYINDKIYVSVTDKQANKVYLFDSQARSISGFPVYGNSSIDLQNCDKDSNLEFITIGSENNILVYEIR